MDGIVFLASDPEGVGGIQHYNKNLIRAAGAAGADVRVVVRERFKSVIAFALASIKTITALVGQANRQTLIWCGHIRFAPIGWILSVIGYRYVVFTHGIEVWQMSASARRALSRAALVITVSRYTESKILTQCPALKGRTFLLPNTVDGETFSPGAPDSGFLISRGLLGAKVILTVARLDDRERYKGYDRVLRALPRIASVVPEVKYLLVGSGADLPRVRALAEELGVAERLIILEHADIHELKLCYRAADVFIMPSTGEGFGIVYLEALASGTPVVAGNKDGSVEAVLGGELGLLVNPEDIKAIANAAIKVLKGTAPKHLLDGNVLREKVLAAYGFNKFEERVKELISKN